MVSHLKLILPLSLREMVLRQVAVLFCRNPDTLGFFYQSLESQLSPWKFKEWLKETEKWLKEGLPESLNKLVIDCIQAIGFGIRKWKKLNRSLWFDMELEIDLPDLSKPCWTTMGAVDYRKVAEQYVLCDRLEVGRRYEIACHNCMENHIPLLWQGLSKGEKKSYSVWGPSLEHYWPHVLKGEESKLDFVWREAGNNLTSLNQWAFEESAENENQVAVEYFYQKLTPAEKEVSLMRTAYAAFEGDVLYYLLSVMTPEQQMEIIKARPAHVLLCFLAWPRLHLLPENADLIWSFLPESDYGSVLKRINMILRHDSCFTKLVQEFFKYAPLDFMKKNFVGLESNSCSPACRLLCTLVEYGDSESIEVMFRHTDVTSRGKLVLHNEVFCIFYECILKEKWQGVEACVRNTAMSKEDKDALKESFRRFLDRSVSGTCVERKFRRFFKLFDETDASDDKERKVKRPKLE